MLILQLPKCNKQELISAHDGFKIIQNLCKNDGIEFIFYISTIDVI